VLYCLYAPSVRGPDGPLGPVPSAVAVLTAAARPDADVSKTVEFLQSLTTRRHFQEPDLESIIAVAGSATPFPGTERMPDNGTKVLGVLGANEVSKAVSAAVAVVNRDRLAQEMNPGALAREQADHIVEPMVKQLRALLVNRSPGQMKLVGEAFAGLLAVPQACEPAIPTGQAGAAAVAPALVPPAGQDVAGNPIHLPAVPATGQAPPPAQPPAAGWDASAAVAAALAGGAGALPAQLPGVAALLGGVVVSPQGGPAELPGGTEAVAIGQVPAVAPQVAGLGAVPLSFAASSLQVGASEPALSVPVRGRPELPGLGSPTGGMPATASLPDLSMAARLGNLPGGAVVPGRPAAGPRPRGMEPTPGHGVPLGPRANKRARYRCRRSAEEDEEDEEDEEEDGEPRARRTTSRRVRLPTSRFLDNA